LPLNRCWTDSHVVNELSNTIDLESTLIRAEALFRRFRRTVEAIDKKQNFPAPKLHQRRISQGVAEATKALDSKSPAESGASGTATGSDVSRPSVTDASKDKGKTPATDPEALRKVISPELRKLLSRKVQVLPRKVVQKKGDGLDSKK
jgi:TBC1 domain family member 15